MSAQRAEPGFRRFLGRLGRRSPGTSSRPSSSPTASPSLKATVCLAVVLDANETMLADMVASVRGHITSWIAVDTAGHAGPRLANELADIPGEVVTRTGLSLPDARNELFAHLPPGCSHVLLLDTDMVLSTEAPLEELAARAPGDALLMRIDDNGYEHRRTLVLRNRDDWSIDDDVRRTVRSTAGFVSATFDQASAVRSADGRRSAERLVRDREVLYRRIEEDPTEASTMFRLAKTLADLGETSPAIWWFTKCAEATDDSEVAYCARSFIGEMHLLSNDLDAAESAFKWAVQARPARAEAYHQLALINNLAKDYPKARMWAEAGMLQRAAHDTLFVQPWMRRWGLPFQWATAAWWTGDAQAARSMFESLHESGLLVEPYASQAATVASRPLPGEEPLRYL